MSGLSKMMKDGWHPEGKGGRKEGWRNDFKGINTVAGWMGKGKEPDSDRSEHVSKPLSALKDPASFAPPPKHTDYYGAAAGQSQTTLDQSGIEAPLPQSQAGYQNAQQQAIEAEEQAAEKPKPPPVPYRVNTTGLTTDNLPPPPVRHLDSPGSASPTNASVQPKPKPSVPPRVPPRNATLGSQDDTPPPAYTPVAPPPSDGYINQEATSRLSNAGVSVPALGIGEANGQSQATSGDAPVNELNSRFSNMQTDPGSRSVPPPPPARPSTLQSAQAFRERHADKIDAGKQKLGGMASRVGTFVEDRRSSPAAPAPPARSSTLPPQNPEPELPPSRPSTLQSAQAFRERHADKIDAGKQKLGGAASRVGTFVEDRRSSPAAPTPPARSSTLPPQNADPELPPSRPSTLQSAQAFRERHADKIDAGKQKLGGAASRVGTFVEDRRSSSAAPTPPARASTLPPRDAESALPPAQGFRERHADKIDLGKQKLGGVTSRINTLVEDHKFSADANKRMPRPPGPNSPVTSSSTANPRVATSSPATAGPDATIEAQARKKAPPPPPPKRADIRAPPAGESPVSSSASTPPPVPMNTKPR